MRPVGPFCYRRMQHQPPKQWFSHFQSLLQLLLPFMVPYRLFLSACCKNQCSGSVTFWYGSGSSDPCLWKKKSQNSRNQGFSYYFCLIMGGSGSVPLTKNPYPGGQKTPGSGTLARTSQYLTFNSLQESYAGSRGPFSCFWTLSGRRRRCMDTLPQRSFCVRAVLLLRQVPVTSYR